MFVFTNRYLYATNWVSAHAYRHVYLIERKKNEIEKYFLLNHMQDADKKYQTVIILLNGNACVAKSPSYVQLLCKFLWCFAVMALQPLQMPVNFNQHACKKFHMILRRYVTSILKSALSVFWWTFFKLNMGFQVAYRCQFNLMNVQINQHLP